MFLLFNLYESLIVFALSNITSVTSLSNLEYTFSILSLSFVGIIEKNTQPNLKKKD